MLHQGKGNWLGRLEEALWGSKASVAQPYAATR